MIQSMRKRLAGHLQSKIHEYLPGYYFSSEDVEEILDQFFKVQYATSIEDVRDELLQILSPWEMPQDRKALNALTTEQLHQKWVLMCEKR